MKFLKKNQVVIYVIALMLVVAGYLNFSTNGDFKTAVQTASSEEELEKIETGSWILIISEMPLMQLGKIKN